MSKPPVDWSIYFWTRVDTSSEEGCWEWQGSRNPRSHYGYVSAPAVFGRKPQTTHRVAWILTYGAIPNGLHVCHKCDNPPCVRPDHLFLGTPMDNTRDKIAKGRMRHGHTYGDDHWTHRHPDRVARGEHHGGAKLTPTQVSTIRDLYAAGGVTQSELADQFGVSRPSISAIIVGRHWKNGG